MIAQAKTKVIDHLQSPIALAVVISIATVAFILAVPSAIGVSFLITQNQIKHNTQQIEQVQRQSVIKAATLERQAKVRAARVQIASAIPTCRTLKSLAEIQGSHGTGSATYGAHLETGIKALYYKGTCPAILAGDYTISPDGVISIHPPKPHSPESPSTSTAK